ncbi:MAG: DUF551 domain-containing protein [Parachlamydia sp.]|nr:DUF551 domain-containing protein [Parachlamydia sp.]
MDWIYIRDKKPDYGQRVIVCNTYHCTYDGKGNKISDCYITEDQYMGDDGDFPDDEQGHSAFSDSGYNVEYWMPLPNPPQPERSKREGPERGCGALDSMET